MIDYMDSLIENQTLELTKLPVENKTLHNHKVYRNRTKHYDNKYGFSIKRVSVMKLTIIILVIGTMVT